MNKEDSSGSAAEDSKDCPGTVITRAVEKEEGANKTVFVLLASME